MGQMKHAIREKDTRKRGTEKQVIRWGWVQKSMLSISFASWKSKWQTSRLFSLMWELSKAILVHIHLHTWCSYFLKVDHQVWDFKARGKYVSSFNGCSWIAFLKKEQFIFLPHLLLHFANLNEKWYLIIAFICITVFHLYRPVIFPIL